MKTEAEFQKFFQTRLLGDLQELEIKRLNVTGKIRILLFFELIVFIGIIIYVFWFRPEKTGTMPEPDFGKIFWIIFSLVMLGIIFVIATNTFSKKFRRGFKEIVIRKIISQISNDITYFPDDKIEVNEFKNSGIFNVNISNYWGRDLIASKIGDISYRFSWLKVDSRKYGSTSYRSTRIGTRSTKSETYQVFQGIFFVADFGTKFQTDAIVWPNFSKKFKLGAIGEFFQDAMLGKRLELKDPVFEKEFAVFGGDFEVVKQILTPGLRQWIMDFRSRTKSILFLSFKGPKMNIAVSLIKQLFEPAIFRKVTDYNFIFENFQYLMLFNGLLEELSKRH